MKQDTVHKQDEVLRELLEATDAAGVPVWFYGGFGLDALEGRRIRPHKDIDFCIRFEDQPALREVLTEAGFAINQAGAHFTLLTKNGQGMEALTFETWADGSIVTNTGETGAFPWPDGSFPDQPNATLLGRPVRAISYEGLYVCKAGYSNYDPSQPLRDKDKADLEIIQSRLSPARRVELEALFGPIPGTRKRFPERRL